jgi:hypothetical protein
MTPIEKMAKAAWNATSDEFNQWDGSLDAMEKIHAIDGMRAALLALAECELLMEVKLAGARAYWDTDDEDMDESCVEDMQGVFAAMLLSIASPQRQDEERSDTGSPLAQTEA